MRQQRGGFEVHTMIVQRITDNVRHLASLLQVARESGSAQVEVAIPEPELLGWLPGRVRDGISRTWRYTYQVVLAVWCERQTLFCRVEQRKRSDCHFNVASGILHQIGGENYECYLFNDCIEWRAAHRAFLIRGSFGNDAFYEHGRLHGNVAHQL